MGKIDKVTKDYMKMQCSPTSGSDAKKSLLPITSVADIDIVPSELIGCFQFIFFQSAKDAVFKALGVELRR